MLIKGVYLDKCVVIRKTKGFFEISNSTDSDIVVNVLSPKDVLVNADKDIFKNFYTNEIHGYKIISKNPVDFEKEDIWVFALLRALEVMNYDDVYAVFEEKSTYVLAYVKDKALMYYEVIFDEGELKDKLKTLDKPILIDANIDFPNTVPALYVKRGELLAFGGALKYIKDKFSQKDAISIKHIKKELVNVGLLMLGIFFSYLIMDFSINYQTDIIKKKEEALFKKTFPNTPVVDIKEQLQAMINPPSSSYILSTLFLKTFEDLPPDAKVYEINYQNDALEIKSQVSSSELPSLKNIYFSKQVSQNSNEVIQRWIIKR